MNCIRLHFLFSFSHCLHTICFGKFSTVEKAEEFKSRFKGLDGFGISEEDLAIQKVEFELDKVDDWVLEQIETYKRRKQSYAKKYGELP